MITYVKVNPFLFLQGLQLGHEPVFGAAGDGSRHGGGEVCLRDGSLLM